MRVLDLARITSSIWRDEFNRGQRFRRLLTFVGWQLWKHTISRPLTVRLFNGYKFIAYPDCTVSSSLLYSRMPNGREISFLRKHLRGGTFLDVGANVGSISLMLADRVDHAVLFEPNPKAASRARENLFLNRLSFDVYELALSDFAGKANLEDRGSVNTTNRIVASRDKTGFPTRVVTVATLDQFLDEAGLGLSRVKVIKIDVEGHENAVLRGALRFLRVARPDLIMFEYLQRTDLRETLSLFGSIGYRVFHLSPNGPVLVDETIPPLRDLFACPDEYYSRIMAGQPQCVSQ